MVTVYSISNTSKILLELSGKLLFFLNSKIDGDSYKKFPQREFSGFFSANLKDLTPKYSAVSSQTNVGQFVISFEELLWITKIYLHFLLEFKKSSKLVKVNNKMTFITRQYYVVRNV